MKEINIAKMIVNKRKEKGITQDQLSKYMGISKASVSKWETGQSYPDITLLPQLATYFNISIDELMGYEPQMQKDEIDKLYHKLSSDFTTKPFDDVLNDCRGIVKKYYSCFPLLLQMGVLLLFHSNLAKSSDKATELVLEAKELFVRVKKESTDLENIRQAKYMEANCYISMGDSQTAITLLEGLNKPLILVETLLATAYQMEGDLEHSKATLQIGIYQYLIGLLSILPMYITLSVDNPKQFDEVIHRAFAMAEAFDIKHLLPSTIMELYLAAAFGYIALGKSEESINMLQKLSDIISDNNYQFIPHSDAFFDLINHWLEKLDLSGGLAISKKMLIQNFISYVDNNPSFSSLADDYRFKNVMKKMEIMKGEIE